MKKIILGALFSTVCSYSVNSSMPWDSFSDQLRTEITNSIEDTWTAYCNFPTITFKEEMTDECKKVYEQFRKLKREDHMVELDLVEDFINIFLLNLEKIKQCKFGTFNNFISKQFKLQHPDEEAISSDTIDLYLSALINLNQITPDTKQPFSYLLVKGSNLAKEFSRCNRANKNDEEPYEEVLPVKRVSKKIKRKKYNDD